MDDALFIGPFVEFGLATSESGNGDAGQQYGDQERGDSGIHGDYVSAVKRGLKKYSTATGGS
jgi:hypothetical protein